MNRKIYELYFTPPDAGAGSGGEADESQSELEQDLSDMEGGEEDSEEEGDDDKSGDDSDDKTDDEGAEGEGEEEESGEADEENESGDEEEEEEESEGEEKKGKGKVEETDETGRPTVKAIRAKYPDVFKDFPALKAGFFLLPKYQEIFADPEQAQEASTKAAEFDRLEASLIDQGSAGDLFGTLSENNPKALKKIVMGLPDAIRQIDNDLYMQLSTPIIEELLYHASKYGEKLGGKNGQNLFLAAKHLANYVFANGGDIPDISKKNTSNEPTEAEKQLVKERAQYRQEKFDNAANEIEPSIATEIGNFIGAKLTDLNPFEKKQVIKDTRREIDNVLKQDRSFQTTMRGLWKRASEDGYSDASKSRIKRAWLDRARAIAPGIRNRLRQEALDARSGKSNSGEGKEKKKRQFPSSGGQAKGRRSGFSDPKKIAWNKTSDLDILNS